LAIHEDEIVAGRFRDARNVTRAREAREQAQRDLAGFEDLFQRVGYSRCSGHRRSPG
jgi:hypothetical protein